MQRISFFALLCILTLSACDSSDPVVRVVSGIYVGNQGNFSDNNGSVSVYDPATGMTDADVIPNLGGLVQNILVDGDRAFVLLNFDDSFSTGRGRIDVVDLTTNQRTAQIDINTPRSAVVLGDTLWVTSLYANTVTPVFLSNNSVGTPIDVGFNPEGIASSEGYLYIANNGFGFSTTVSRVEIASESVVGTLDLGCDGPRNVVTDADGQVWVFCTGKTVYDDDYNIVEQTNGAVVVLNGSRGAEIDRINFDAQFGGGAIGQDAVMVDSRSEIWAVLGSDLMRFDTNTNSMVQTLTPTFTAGRTIGAVGYDELNDNVLVGSFVDYTSAGSVTIADRMGSEIESFSAGVAPSTIVVREGVE